MSKLFDAKTCVAPPDKKEAGSTLVLKGEGLTINDVVNVARFGTKVQLTKNEAVLRRVEASHKDIVEAVREVVGQPPTPDRPYIRNDNEQSLSDHICKIADDIAAYGCIPGTVEEVLTNLEKVS